MKREWDIEELIAHFTLTKSETALLDNKTSHTQLGLATLLKYFQSAGVFPKRKRDIPGAILEFIAQQLGVDAAEFSHYQWEGSTIKRDRAVIQDYLRFREATEEDRSALTGWLIEHPAMQREHSEGYWTMMAYTRLRELGVEPFTTEKMARLVRSALNAYQEQVCEQVHERLSASVKEQLDTVLMGSENNWSRLARLKDDPGGVDLKNVLEAGEKLRDLRSIGLSSEIFAEVDPKWVEVYRGRATVEHPSDLWAHPDPIRYTLLAAFCVVRKAEITDQLIELLMQIIHKIGTRAERTIDSVAIKDIQRVYGKSEMLFKMAKASLSDPSGSVEQVIFKVVSEDKLQRVVEEREDQPLTYRQEVGQVMRRSYGRMLAIILETLQFRSNNVEYEPVLHALHLVEKYLARRNLSFYPAGEFVPMDGVVRPGWLEVVVVVDERGTPRISRLDYELCVLGALREKLRATEIWVDGARKYGNPDKVLPADFEAQREHYCALLNQPVSAAEFIARLRTLMKQTLSDFNAAIPFNPYVKLLSRKWTHSRVATTTSAGCCLPERSESGSRTALGDDPFAGCTQGSRPACAIHR